MTLLGRRTGTHAETCVRIQYPPSLSAQRKVSQHVARQVHRSTVYGRQARHVPNDSASVVVDLGQA